MTKTASLFLICCSCMIPAVGVAVGQSAPVRSGSPLYTGFQLPTVGGTLHYSLSAAERLTFGYTSTLGTVSAATVSGNIGLITPSKSKPTDLSASIGYLASTGGGQPSAFFTDFSISQSYDTKNWKLKLIDSFRYLPETSSAGLSGIAGIGNVGTIVPGIPSQGVFIPFATRIENSADADVTRVLTGRTSATVIGGYSLERFPGYTGGIQTDVYSISGLVNHRLNALSSAGGSYHYSRFSYVGVNGVFQSQGISAFYKRQVSRRLTLNLGGGPQIISGSSLTGQPASVSYTADLQATYIGSIASGLAMSASYKRSTNGGSGITFGAINDTVNGSVSRRLTRSLNVSALGTYSHSAGLQLITKTQISTQSFDGSFQANRAITEKFSAYVSYTVLHQSIQGANYNGTPLNGLQQVLGFGVTYSPSAIHLGR